MIPNDFIQELRARLDIVQVVSGYVSLSSKGDRHWGLCPFHSEKTPSFSVSRQRQIYKCFGCGEGGDVISFVMALESLEFTEAVEQLAQRAGLTVPKVQGGDPELKNRREAALEALTLAAKWYHGVLTGEGGMEALNYLLRRGIDSKTVRKFGIGFSPNSWDGLINYLEGRGISKEAISDAGLSVTRGDNRFDMFRGRVMFPIFDPRGRVIAFGGRVLGDEQPKYLNSSETIVFKKGENLYGINLLKGLKRIDEVRLVEGYADVVSLCAHGVPGCVASLGTSLTSSQARLITRYCKRAVICYDGDSAGKAAAARAIPVLEAQGIAVKVTVIPGGVDPDDYIRANGSGKFMGLPRESGTDFLIGLEREKFDLADGEGKAMYAMAACNVLKSVAEPVLLAGAVARLSAETGFPSDVLYNQIGKSVSLDRVSDINYRFPAHNISKKAAYPPGVKAQRMLLALMAGGLKLPEGMIKAEDFTDELCARLAGMILQRQGESMLSVNILDELKGDDAARSEAAGIILEIDEQDQGKRVKIAMDCVRVMRAAALEEELTRIDEQIAGMPVSGQMELLKRHRALNEQLQSLKSAGKE